MKPRKVAARISATPEEHKALFSLLEKERDRLIEAGESESSPLGRALWAATDGLSQVLAQQERKKSGQVDLTRIRAKLR